MSHEDKVFTLITYHPSVIYFRREKFRDSRFEYREGLTFAEVELDVIATMLNGKDEESPRFIIQYQGRAMASHNSDSGEGYNGPDSRFDLEPEDPGHNAAMEALATDLDLIFARGKEAVA